MLAVEVKLIAILCHSEMISLVLLRLNLRASVSIDCLSLQVIMPIFQQRFLLKITATVIQILSKLIITEILLLCLNIR